MLEPNSTDSDSGEEVSGIRWFKEKINKSWDILNLFQKHLLKLDIHCNSIHGVKSDKKAIQLMKKLRKVLKATELNIKTLDDDILASAAMKFSKKESEQLFQVNYDSSFLTKKSSDNSEEPPLILHIKRKPARAATSRTGPKKTGRTTSVNSLSEFLEEDETQQDDIDINKVLATLNKDISSDEDGGKNCFKNNSDDDGATEDCFIKDCKVKVQRLGRRTVSSSSVQSKKRNEKRVKIKSTTPSPKLSTRGKRSTKKVSYKDRESSGTDSESEDTSRSSRTTSSRARGSRSRREERSKAPTDEEDDEARVNGEESKQVNGAVDTSGTRSLRQRNAPKKEPSKSDVISPRKRGTRAARSARNSDKSAAEKVESEAAGDSDQSRSRRSSSRRSQRKPPVSYVSDQDEVDDEKEEKETHSVHSYSDTDSLDNVPTQKPDAADTEDIFEKLREDPGAADSKANDPDSPVHTTATGKQR